MARGGWGSATHYRAYLFKAALRHFSHPIQVSNKNLFCRNLYRFSALSCFLRAMTVYHYPLSIIVHYRSLSTFHCQSQKVTWFKKLYSSSNQPLYESLKSSGRENILNLHLFFLLYTTFKATVVAFFVDDAKNVTK